MPPPAGKFLPPATPLSRTYWEACREHRLLIQKCSACGHHQFYPRTFCTECMQAGPQWVPASGHGTVETWTVVRRPVSQAYAAETPYVIALIRLEEGPVMMSHVTGCEPDEVQSGMRVKVTFRDWSEDIAMPVFAPPESDG